MSSPTQAIISARMSSKTLRMFENGYLIQEPSTHNRRSIRVPIFFFKSLTHYSQVEALFRPQIANFSETEFTS